jgi:uncharacterized protein (DUF488 family)
MTGNGDMEKPLIRTVGHSTQPVDVLIEILLAHDIERLIDVRTIPKSKYNPQYNREALERSLRDEGFAYEHARTLGGCDIPVRTDQTWAGATSRCAVMRSTCKRRSPILRCALGEAVIHEAVVIMCAEAMPWRCHRSLISDALTRAVTGWSTS